MIMVTRIVAKVAIGEDHSRRETSPGRPAADPPEGSSGESHEPGAAFPDVRPGAPRAPARAPAERAAAGRPAAQRGYDGAPRSTAGEERGPAPRRPDGGGR